MTMEEILAKQAKVKVLKPGRGNFPSPPTARPPSTIRPAAQLEIAAQWLCEAGALLDLLKHDDLAGQCKRVAQNCLSVAHREST